MTAIQTKFVLRNRRRLWAALAVVGLACGAVVLARGGSGRSSRGGETALATVGAFDITTTANGELEAKNQTEIRNQLEVPTTLVEVAAEGTRVKPGDVLVRLNPEQVKQNLETANLELETAKANFTAAEHAYEIQVSENEQKLRQAGLKLELAQIDYQQWLEGEVRTKRQANSLALTKTQLEVDRLAQKLGESFGLLSNGYLSRDEYEQDKLKYIEAGSAWITAVLTNDVYENFEFSKTQLKKLSDIEDSKANLEQVKLSNGINLASKQAARSNSHTQLTLREERFKKFTDQLEACTIKAPREGMVVYANSSERFWGPNMGPLVAGRQVMNGECLMFLPDTSKMMASVKVHETLADKVKKGQRATVKVDGAGGRTFEGVIESIGTLAESNNWRDPNLKEYTVKIAIQTGDEATTLKPSGRCEARLFLDHVENATTVPVQAVFTEGNVRFVYLPEGNGKFRRHAVKLGRRSDTMAEIVKGLETGTTVLVREPQPGEVSDEAWTEDELKMAGYESKANGEIVAQAVKSEAAPAPAASSTSAAKEAAATTATPAVAAAKPETKTEAKPAAKPEVKPVVGVKPSGSR